MKFYESVPITPKLLVKKPFLCFFHSSPLYHPGLTEINAAVGSKEVMSLGSGFPLKTIAGCRLGPIELCPILSLITI